MTLVCVPSSIGNQSSDTSAGRLVRFSPPPLSIFFSPPIGPTWPPADRPAQRPKCFFFENDHARETKIVHSLASHQSQVRSIETHSRKRATYHTQSHTSSPSFLPSSIAHAPMDIAHPTCRKVESLGFHVYTADEIRKISVKALNQPILFNELGHPNKGGLYDPALGPLEKHGRCVTCHLPQNACPGHLGHIELAVPLYNPLLFTDLLRLLKMVCLHCHSFKMAKSKVWRASETMYGNRVGISKSRCYI